MCGDWLPGANLRDRCQQKVRFVGRELFIEYVDLYVFVLAERAALEAILRKFDVLQRGNICQCFV